MSALSLKGNSFYRIMIEEPSNVPCWVQRICNNPWALRFIPNLFKTQRMCEKAAEVCSYQLKYAPGHFKTQEMCDKAVRRHAWQLEDVPDYSKTQEMCNKAMHEDPAVFFLVPDRFKTQEMCIKSLEVCSCLLNDVRMMTVARERSRLVPLKAMPADIPTLVGNAAIEIPPVITVDVIRPVSTIPVIVLNRFIFLAICSQNSILSSKNASISVNFFNRYVCGSCGAVGFKSG